MLVNSIHMLVNSTNILVIHMLANSIHILVNSTNILVIHILVNNTNILVTVKYAHSKNNIVLQLVL